MVDVCPVSGGTGSTSTDFQKTNRRSFGVIEGPLQQWELIFPARTETPGNTYTVTDIFPDNIVVVEL